MRSDILARDKLRLGLKEGGLRHFAKTTGLSDSWLCVRYSILGWCTDENSIIIYLLAVVPPQPFPLFIINADVIFVIDGTSSMTPAVFSAVCLIWKSLFYGYWLEKHGLFLGACIYWSSCTSVLYWSACHSVLSANLWQRDVARLVHAQRSWYFNCTEQCHIGHSNA